MEETKPRLSKRTIYTIFIGKFIFSLGLIFWTIKMTLGAGVGLDDDNSFFSSYHKIDDNFNKISYENNIFNKKYQVIFEINNNKFDKLSYDDIYLSQRIIKKRDDRKDILKVGKNFITMKIIDRKTSKQIKDYDATVICTTTVNHKNDLEFKLKDGVNNFDISKKSYWNIMGKVKINNDIGHFYIKTNSK